MSDRQTAERIYAWAGIPPAEWEAHWRMDSHKGAFRKRVGPCYRAILASMRAG